MKNKKVKVTYQIFPLFICYYSDPLCSCFIPSVVEIEVKVIFFFAVNNSSRLATGKNYQQSWRRRNVKNGVGKRHYRRRKNDKVLQTVNTIGIRSPALRLAKTSIYRTFK